MRRGVETMVQSLANELAKRDLDVSVLTARQTQAPLVPLSPQVRVKQFPTFRYYEFASIAPMYAFDLIRNRYDIVIVFFADFGEGRALTLASRLFSPRMFLYLTFPYESAPHRYQAYRRWGWDIKAERILADAEYTARRGEKFFQRKVEVLPSGTDPNRFKPDQQKRMALRKEFGFRDDDIVLLNVAALEGRKGVGRVVEALPKIKASVPNIRYLILGDGPQKAQLQQRVAELDLDRHVIFAGTTAELPRYYNAADIFVMLSDAEAGSLACLEAMASGLPVVVSSSGGFNEAVDECSGRMVNKDNPTEIVQAMQELAIDPALRWSLGQAGRRRVITKFSWERIGEQLYQLCQPQNKLA